MHNWDYDQKTITKNDAVWRLERLINYGLAGEKINRKDLEEHIGKLHITTHARAFLELLLWNRPF